MRPQNGMMDCQNATSLSSHNHVILSSCLGKFICNYLLVIAGWVKLMYFSCFSLLLCCRFPNKQTRKQPQSTEGSIWPMFFVDGSRCFCVCGQLSCARLGNCWELELFIYTNECFYVLVFLKEKMVQSLSARWSPEEGERGRTIWTKLLSDKGSLFFQFFVGPNKTITPGQ